MAPKNNALVPDAKTRKSLMCSVLKGAAVVILVYWIGSVFIVPGYRRKTLKVPITESMNLLVVDRCENQCRPRGSESLPEGIVAQHSGLEMRPLWGLPKKRESSVSLLALAVGIKQKQLVNELILKFITNGFTVMLFHYDGIIDEWRSFEWNDRVIHVSAINQTKWWFAKRFLHPDVVAAYDYVFLWDEDLGVEDFNPQRYISIVKEEGLEISQPALDGNKSEVHHQITSRGRRGDVHRRTYKHGECDDDSTGPPCTGWIEVMAPVFSRAAWRCVWYMIQNDCIHAWGLDMHLGYCAQGDRTQNIGIVDAEYVVHHGLTTLGEPSGKKRQLNVLDERIEDEVSPTLFEAGYRFCCPHARVGIRILGPSRNTEEISQAVGGKILTLDAMQYIELQVRRQSYNEYKVFRRRWDKAAKMDECWKDPYPTESKPMLRY